MKEALWKQCQSQYSFACFFYLFIYFKRSRKIWTKDNKSSWLFVFQKIWKCMQQFIYLFLDGYLAFLGSTTPWLFRYLNTSLKWNLVYGFTRPYLWTECPSDKQTYQSQEHGRGKVPKTEKWEDPPLISSTLPVTSTKFWMKHLAFWGL